MRPLLLPSLVACTGVFAQQWTQLPDFPGTARDDAAAFTIGTDIYVGTGMEVGWGLTADWWKYDIIGATWTQVASLPTSSRQYCAAFSLQEKGYLFGGTDGTDPLNELWMYDPASDAWSQRASLPDQGRYAAVALSNGTEAFVCTGMQTDGTPTNTCWRYDPIADAWYAAAPLPGIARHRATALTDGTIAMAGGADASDQPLADGYRLDGSTWTPIADLPQPRFAGRGSGELFIGGSTSFAQEHADVWHYTGWADSWTEMPAFGGGPRRGGVAAAVVFFSLSAWYHGLGLHGSDRYKDWWKLDMDVGLDEHAGRTIALHPNPAHDRLTITLARQWSAGAYLLIDGPGRIVGQGRIPSTGTIPLDGLAAGRYTIRVGYDGQWAHASFIKLP